MTRIEGVVETPPDRAARLVAAVARMVDVLSVDVVESARMTNRRGDVWPG
jgi:hypothetical protein